jgi:hypothetical protein
MKQWEHVTIGNLLKVIDTQSENLDDLEKQVKVLSILTGKDEDIIWDLPKYKFLELSERFKFITDLPPEKKVSSFEAGGYTWIPQTDISKFTSGQYMDMTEYCKEPLKNSVKMLATISTPVKHYPLFIKTRPKMTFEEKAKILEKAKVCDVWPLSLFFCRVLIHLTNAMQDSLKEDIERLMSQATINGDGMKSSTA